MEIEGMLPFSGSPPPKKRARTDCFGEDEDYADSDDSFNDPVLAEPSQITQAIMHRTRVSQCSENLRASDFTGPSACTLTSPLHAPRDYAKERKHLSRIATAITPRRFNAQEKSDYHHNGQVLMLKNRVENLEREKERAAATTRDQLIAKEKEYASEVSRRDERIRHLESQIQALRQQNLQSSFQLHNVSTSETVDVEVAGANSTLPLGPLLHTKKVSFPRNDMRWKSGVRFGAGTTVFPLSSNGVGIDNGSQSFAHIPSQLLTNPPGVDTIPQLTSTSPYFEKNPFCSEDKECQVSRVSEDWNVHSAMRESSMESLLSISLISQESNFELSTLSILCRVEHYLDLKGLLLETSVGDDSFS